MEGFIERVKLESSHAYIILLFQAAMDKLLTDFSAAAKRREEEKVKEMEARRAEEAEKQKMLEELENNKNEIAKLREEAKRKKESNPARIFTQISLTLHIQAGRAHAQQETKPFPG